MGLASPKRHQPHTFTASFALITGSPAGFSVAFLMRLWILLSSQKIKNSRIVIRYNKNWIAMISPLTPAEMKSPRHSTTTRRIT